MSADKPVSIVVAAYNESENVSRLYQEIRRHVSAEPHSIEIIFVDDGSRDDTAGRVLDLRAQDPSVRLVRLSRNFGNQAAFLAGIQSARGDAIITMDCDLQHPPALLPKMLQAWRDGAGLVQMERRQNAGSSWFHRISSRLFHEALRKLTDIPLPAGAGDFRLMDRRAADLMMRFAVSRPFYRGMPFWLGLRSRTMTYDAGPRHAGRAPLTFFKRVELSLDAITALSVRPLRLAFFLGACAIALCLLYTLVTLGAYLSGYSVPGYPTLVFVIVFLGAIQLISIGILGEYLGRIHEQSRRLPPFVLLDDPDESRSEMEDKQSPGQKST
ncbi:MAG: glycosyltransferase family 2 protein [Acidobacteria bacterium]|nr:glycosyltransferase family 2 protein [Acidobacteriota bacterium]